MEDLLRMIQSATPWTAKWVVMKPLAGGGQGDTLVVETVSEEFDQAVLKLLKPDKSLVEVSCLEILLGVE